MVRSVKTDYLNSRLRKILILKDTKIMQELLQKLIWNVIIPVVALVASKYLWDYISSYASTLWVEGKVDEWVVIMRSGKMVAAGIGLKTFKGPLDQVAKFPAKIHRVQFSTENVTKEMQGVKVSGMLVWTILRTDDGPF